MGEWTWRKVEPPKLAGDVLGSVQTLVSRLNLVLRRTLFEIEHEARPFRVNVDWNPANVGAGAQIQQDVDVPGVRLGNVVLAGFSQLLPDGLFLTGRVVADNTVRVTLENTTGAAHDAAAGVLSVRVWE